MYAPGTMQISEAFRNVCRSKGMDFDEFNDVAKNLEAYENDEKWKPIMEEANKYVGTGIDLIETEEGYTSGTSFLDDELPIKGNYNKSRRVYRGLFKSNNGEYINADVNGAFQIMRKVFSNVKADEIVGAYSHPVIINL